MPCSACSGFARTRLAVSSSAGPIARLELAVSHMLRSQAARLVVPSRTDADRRQSAKAFQVDVTSSTSHCGSR